MLTPSAALPGLCSPVKLHKCFSWLTPVSQRSVSALGPIATAILLTEAKSTGLTCRLWHARTIKRCLGPRNYARRNTIHISQKVVITFKAHSSCISSFALTRGASLQAVEMDNGQVSSSLQEAAEAADIKQYISQALEGLNRGIFGVQV